MAKGTMPTFMRRILNKPDDGQPRMMRKPDIKLPEGYSDEMAFLSEMREFFDTDVATDWLNREAAQEDAAFFIGEQWDTEVRSRRIAGFKPVLTINRLPAFVAQVLGSRRLNETQIKVIPDTGGSKPVATVREGLIRNIQKNTRAKGAYDNALAGAVIGGIGNFQLDLDYESEDVFFQKINITPILDHLSVVWDSYMTEPTGKDATRVFVTDAMSKSDFYAQWGWATPADVIDGMATQYNLRSTGWVTNDAVRVVDYWRMRSVKRTIAMFNDGSVRDVTDEVTDDFLADVKVNEDGVPFLREVNRKFAQLYVCTATDILEGPYNLPINRVPVFRVPGWELQVGSVRHRWGLLRFLKDPQRLHNYWRSAIAEKLMQTPRAVWLASDAAVSGREQSWRNSHLSDDPLLIYNGEAGEKPERVPPAQLEGALIQEANVTSQDIKDVSNIHEANLGMPSNEVSGAAIVARQRVSDTGTILYHDNLGAAIEECGRVINDLIPSTYNQARMIKIIGEDDKEALVGINAPGMVDIVQGKYLTSVSTGPSYQTKRIEAAANMRDLASALPQTMQVAADLFVEAQDWPDSSKIAARIKNTIPPELLGEDEITPQIKAKMDATAQANQQTAELAAKTALAEFMKTQSEGMLNMAKAEKLGADADVAEGKLRNESIKTASDAAQSELKGHLDAIKLATEAPTNGKR